MSNKPNHFKKDSFVQIGNFKVSFDEGQLQSVKITAVAGNWNIRFREDNALFHWISNEMKTGEGRKILHLVFAAYYMVCNGVPDNIFYGDILKAYQNSLDRMAGRQELSKEEDDKILEEEKEKYNNLKTGKNDAQN